MDIIIVLSWVGVCALAIGSLISIVSGGSLFLALTGILLTSITISSIIPINGKLRLVLGGARIEMVQRVGVVVGAVGSWVMAGVGGWVFVPAGVVLSVAAGWWPVMRVIEMRRARRSAVSAGMISNHENEQDKRAFESPPQYTPANPATATIPVIPASTVTIVTEESAGQSPLKTPGDSKMQTQVPVLVTVSNV